MNISNLAEEIIKFLARQLPYKNREKRQDEWLAILDHIPKHLSKLLYSLSLIPATFKICGSILIKNFSASVLTFTEDFLSILFEHFKIVYFTLILTIFPMIAISLTTCLILVFYGKNYSGIFPLMYLMLFMLPSLFSIIQGGAYNNLLSCKFKLPELWFIPPQYLNLWFSAKIISLTGIMFFNNSRASNRFMILGIICIYIVLWPLARTYLKNNAELISPQN